LSSGISDEQRAHTGGLMIAPIEFRNFKVLQEAAVSLGRFNLLVGPNGSGKTTVLTALRLAGGGATLPPFNEVASAGTAATTASVSINFSSSVLGDVRVVLTWDPGVSNGNMGYSSSGVNYQTVSNELRPIFSALRIYSLDAEHIAAPV